MAALSEDAYEAIVIGSGFGGAVATCRLAQAGVDVALLERGRRYSHLAMSNDSGAEEWEQGDVLRSADRSRVLLFARAPMPADVAMLRGRTFATAVVAQVDQTGARMLEARVLEPVEPEERRA